MRRWRCKTTGICRNPLSYRPEFYVVDDQGPVSKIRSSEDSEKVYR